MRALDTVYEKLSESMGFMHAARWRAIWVTVLGLISGGKLWLTALGRARKSATSAKHSIKAVDRLFGNGILYAERELAYAAIASLLLKRRTHPVILVDTVEVRTTTFALTASVAFNGRAFPLLASIVTGAVPAVPALKKFAKQLARVLPEGCTPIVVSDAGFGADWFETLEALDWNYVGRIRGNTNVSFDGEQWLLPAQVHTLARGRTKNLGDCLLFKSRPQRRRLVLSKRPRRPRRKRWTRRGHVGRRGIDREHSKNAREPWLLVTSLQCRPANVVDLYALRMQIEENYRDAKNHRWGWSLRHLRSTQHTRLEIAFLIATIACFVQQSIGVAAEQLALHHRHQANTLRDRRVLSFFLLGRLVLQCGDGKLLTRQSVERALAAIRRTIALHGRPASDP